MIPEAYTLSAARPDWPALLASWRPLIPGGATPWLLSRFGEPFFEQVDRKIGMLQVSALRYVIVAQDRHEFALQAAETDRLADWFLAPLVDRLVAAGRTLPAEHCYSFVMPLAFGGQLSPENVMVIPVAQHFGCWGDVFQQTKNLPDGTPVELKIESPPPAG